MTVTMTTQRATQKVQNDQTRHLCRIERRGTNPLSRQESAMGGFKKFLIRGNLVDLAVAFVVGAAFAGLVKDFTTAFISPLLALFGGKPDYTRLAFKIN